MQYFNTTPSNIKDFVVSFTGDASVFVEYTPEDYKLVWGFGKKSVTIDFPRLVKSPLVKKEAAYGYIATFDGGTKRFVRAEARHFEHNGYFEYSKKGIYVAEIWCTVAEMMSTCIKENNIESFGLWVNEYLRRQELIKNPWSTVVMSQEIKVVVESLPWDKPLAQEEKKGATLALHMALYESGFSLSATSKSDAGSIVTKLIKGESNRTLLSQVLLPQSCRRACRAEREQRGIREAIEFVNPVKPTLYLEGMKIPEQFLPYLTEIPVLFADFPHNTPSYTTKDFNTFADEKWNPSSAGNKDRIIITGLGQEMLRAHTQYSRVMSEERYESQREYLCTKHGFSIDWSEKVSVGQNISAHNVHVTYSETEKKANYVKLVTATGLKGMTEPVKQRFFVSHKNDVHTGFSKIEGALENKLDAYKRLELLQEVAAVVSVSAIRSKKAEASLVYAVQSRMCREGLSSPVIEDASGEAWVDKIVPRIGEELASVGLSSKGTMFVYTLEGGHLIPIRDKDGGNLQAVFGYLPFWRTRHADRLGGDAKVFMDKESKGVAVDIHTAKTGGVKWLPNVFAQEKLNCIEAGLVALQSKRKTEEIEED